jgi:hypothetical protein
MSWGAYSGRNFNWANKSTPENIGPGAYRVSKSIEPKKPSKYPFNVNYDEPPPPENETRLGPGCYDFDLPSSHQSIRSVFISKTSRDPPKIPDYPDPTKYQHLKSWPMNSKKRNLNRSKTPVKQFISSFVRQNTRGFAVSENGTLIPIPQELKTEEDIGLLISKLIQARIRKYSKNLIPQLKGIFMEKFWIIQVQEHMMFNNPHQKFQPN